MELSYWSATWHDHNVDYGEESVDVNEDQESAESFQYPVDDVELHVDKIPLFSHIPFLQTKTRYMIILFPCKSRN